MKVFLKYISYEFLIWLLVEWMYFHKSDSNLLYRCCSNTQHYLKAEVKSLKLTCKGQKLCSVEENKTHRYHFRSYRCRSVFAFSFLLVPGFKCPSLRAGLLRAFPIVHCCGGTVVADCTGVRETWGMKEGTAIPERRFGKKPWLGTAQLLQTQKGRSQLGTEHIPLACSGDVPKFVLALVIL